MRWGAADGGGVRAHTQPTRLAGTDRQSNRWMSPRAEANRKQCSSQPRPPRPTSKEGRREETWEDRSGLAHESVGRIRTSRAGTGRDRKGHRR
jgi:hypothetical protein